MSTPINRRNFLGQASCAAVGSTALLSTLTNFMLTNAAIAANENTFSDYRALICLFLPGGNDSFNMLVPTGTAYQEYATVRGDLAIPQANLLPITPQNTVNRPVALHPGMGGIKTLFDNGKLSFIANIGALTRPTTIQDFRNGIAPYGVFSHSDQQEIWQTSIPDSRSGIGWAGKAADILMGANRTSKVSMNISISGNNLWQVGNDVIPYTVNRNGATSLDKYHRNTDPIYKTAIDSQLAQEYSNVLEATYSTMKRNSLDAFTEFDTATNAPLPTDTMGNGELGESLRQIAKIIGGRNALGAKRQIFYLQWGGWDFHDNVIQNMNTLMPELSSTLKSFYDLLANMGVENNVTLYQATEFGRSLTSNAAGSDHGWGGNTFVMGGAVKGGRIFGQYPNLFLGNPLDTDRGCLIPTTSIDELFGELALWMGVSKSELPTILPNLSKFYNISGTAAPIGFMS